MQTLLNISAKCHQNRSL